MLAAARRCNFSSSLRFMPISMAMVIRLRVCRGRPGRVQISPQAWRVIISWNSLLKSVRLFRLRST
ncbi:hypothetical protein D3C77_701010 [compost metagenome]